MKESKVASLERTIIAFVVLSVFIFSDAKIVNPDSNTCDEADPSDPCIDCEIKTMSASSLMLSQATIDHYGKEANLKSEKHSKDKLQVFHCKCVKLSSGEILKGTFDEATISDLDDEFVDEDDDDWKNWKKSEVLKISDCDELSLKLEGDFQTEMGLDEGKQTILIVENVKKVEMDFKMEEASNGRFTSVSFRDVSFSEDYDNQLLFELEKSNDAIELLFDTIKITKGKFTIEQQNSNIDPENDDKLAVDPMLTIINSTIGSDIPTIDDIANVIDLEFKVIVANLQRDKDCVKKVDNDKDEKEDDCRDECFFDYMGQVKINKNRFTFLNTEAITILNAKMLEFYGNTVELNMDNALYVANVKDLNISENRFEFVGKTPALQIVYKYSATELADFEYLPDDLTGNDWRESFFEDGCGDPDEADFASMKANKIRDVKIMKNLFGKLHKETIKYKIDTKYDKDFAVKTFIAEGTSNRKPCKCPIPKTEDDDDINTNLTMSALKMQACLSPQHPPVLGNRADICAGKYPKSLSEKLEDAEGGIRPWHLVLAILLTIIITAIMVFVIVRFCCMSEEAKSRSVTPDA